jgi:CheY-like chemotaxis protein
MFPGVGGGCAMKILFVDDDPADLELLHRTVQPMAREWEVAFAEGAKQALAMLESAPCDAVVTDMQMPDMDGATLLDQVKERRPEIIRILLTDPAQTDLVPGRVEPAHQYLFKPCRLEPLKAVIERVQALQCLLASETMRQVIARIGVFPSAPSFYVKLVRELRSQEVSAQKVADTLAEDVGMAAKVMQLVNSAFFGLRSPVSGMTHAISILGFKMVTALALSV